MFQPNSLRALRELKLDKELEKNSMQFQQNDSSQIKNKKSRSVSNTENMMASNNNNNYDSSDLSDDDQEYQEQNRPQSSSGNIEGGQQSKGLMSNNSEYFQKMKSLLEKNPYHPMNFIFDHKDLLNELNQFIKETREWRETQKKELEKQLEFNKQRAITSVEENEELQKKIKEQLDFEIYLEKVQQIQKEYNSDIDNYQKYMKKTDNKENRPQTGKSASNENENKELNKLIEDSKKKVQKMGNIDEYLYKAQMEVEYNKITSDAEKMRQNEQDNNNYDDDEQFNHINDHLISDISIWEKQVDELLLNLNDKPTDLTLTSKQRVQSARQNLKQQYAPSKDDELEKEMEELDKEFKELEEMLDSANEPQNN